MRRLGLLLLDTHFPRPPGDIGNPQTFAGPVLVRRVPAATAKTVVVDEELPEALTAAFIAEAHALVAEGAEVITTSCGFLSPLQPRLEAELSVPVLTSALWLLPDLRRQYGPGATLGIMTFDSRTLSARHIPDEGPVQVSGLQDGHELYRVIRNDETDLDLAAAERDAADATRRLMAAAPDTKVIVVECTNLPPYRDAIAAVAGVPVVDIRDGLAPLLNP